MSNLLEQAGQDAGAGVTTDKTVRSVTSSDSPEIALLTSIAAGGGSVAVTYDAPVSIEQGSTPALLSLKTGAGTKVVRLHALVGTLHAAGTLKVSYADNAGTSNEVDLTGEMTIAKNGGIPIHFIQNPEGCLKTAAGKFLTITSATGAFNGYAITSTADA